MTSVVKPSSEWRCQPVAMLHVHCTSAILNHCHAELLKVRVPTAEETRQTSQLIGKLVALRQAYAEPIVEQVAPNCRSVIFGTPEAEPILAEFGTLPYVKSLVDRAVSEAQTYWKHGIRMMELENVVAPYFIGAGECPWEELVILLLCARAVRAALPDACLGVHILSCNELEVLPIGIDMGAYFVRSEATLFAGVRPEGPTKNNANLARYLYSRRVLRQLKGGVTAEVDQLAYPQIWSDVLKKHTVWPDNLLDDKIWLNNIPFMKLEGVIVTGPETGSNVTEAQLQSARTSVDSAKAFVQKTIADGKAELVPPLPVVTGSGGDFEMYCKYADFIIVGTALKQGSYWENPVDEANVQAVVERLRKAQA